MKNEIRNPVLNLSIQSQSDIHTKHKNKKREQYSVTETKTT